LAIADDAALHQIVGVSFHLVTGAWDSVVVIITRVLERFCRRATLYIVWIALQPPLDVVDHRLLVGLGDTEVPFHALGVEAIVRGRPVPPAFAIVALCRSGI
jgi:hypothetical protein